MKKILVFLVLIGFMFGVMGFVVGEQLVQVTGSEVINFSLNNLDFGPMISGQIVNLNSNVTLDISNNVDFEVTIALNTGDFVLDEILFDLSLYGGSATARLGSGPLSAKINDTDTTEPGVQQLKQLPVSLTMPAGALPGVRQRAIVYTITGAIPPL